MQTHPSYALDLSHPLTDDGYPCDSSVVQILPVPVPQTKADFVGSLVGTMARVFLLSDVGEPDPLIGLDRPQVTLVLSLLAGLLMEDQDPGLASH